MSKKETAIINEIKFHLNEFLEDDGTIFSRFPVLETEYGTITITIERHKECKCVTKKD